MSAFVVGAETISRVIDGLRLVDMPREPAETDSGFGRRLLALNLAAVRARYDESIAAEMMPGIKYEYREPAPVRGCAADIAAWKAIECFLYQCAEGNIPERPLYQAIEQHHGKLGARILEKHNNGRRHPRAKVWDIPEIERAAWGD